jgi:spore maturation protein SpmA
MYIVMRLIATFIAVGLGFIVWKLTASASAYELRILIGCMAFGGFWLALLRITESSGYEYKPKNTASKG